MIKKCMTDNYHYRFDTDNGFFIRWGKNIKEDAILAPAPEILDIEVTTICSNGCPFCYKSNTTNGKNMSLHTFKSIIDRIPSVLQIAFGADAGAISNPDLFRMMDYAKSKTIVSNITVADITDETASKLAKHCGAVAVSSYRGSKTKKIRLKRKKT